jgi:hypothetical protein
MYTTTDLIVLQKLISGTIKFYQNPLAFLKCFFDSFKPQEAQAIADSKTFFKTDMGYFFEQSTKPQTIGYSLTDSPVGLLAWIYEKLVAWTDSYPWTDDEGMVVRSSIKS